jgi:hypothetical protein
MDLSVTPVGQPLGTGWARARALRWFWAGALLIGSGVGPALGQAGGSEPRLERPAEADCVVDSEPKDPALEYPFLEYKEATPGKVRLELHFTGPTLRPAVKVLQSEGGDAFVKAAREYVDRLRMPCMQVTERGVRLVQDYIFSPDLRKPVPSALDMADAPRRKELLACLKTPAVDDRDYPQEAQRRNLQGRVVVEAEFTSADQAPKLTLHHRRNARILAQAAERTASKLRLPCFAAGQDEPLKVSFVYVYRFDGEAYGFKPLTLVQLLPAVKGIRPQGLKLDTRAMGCPIDLRFFYRQPHLPNSVEELGNSQASREPLLKWLRGVELDLPEATLDSVYGDTADIAVPCININIPPQPKETS